MRHVFHGDEKTGKHDEENEDEPDEKKHLLGRAGDGRREDADAERRDHVERAEEQQKENVSPERDAEPERHRNEGNADLDKADEQIRDGLSHDDMARTRGASP